jgi:hypothetical protein
MQCGSESILGVIIFCLQDESLHPSTKYTMKYGPKDFSFSFFYSLFQKVHLAY